MPLTIIQSGASLQRLNDAGELLTLTLPAGVTLRTDVAPRWAVFGHMVVLVNTPSRPLTIDASGIVRVLTPTPPRIAPILSGPVAGALSGTFRSWMTNVIQDEIGNVLAESDFSPSSNAVAIASKMLRASGLDISPDDITGRRLYRTTDNGAVKFQWVDLDGNVLTSVDDDLSDEGLAVLAAPRLGTPPRLTTIAEFRGRLFGTGDVDVDTVRYTEAGIGYAWPDDNGLESPDAGADAFGVVGLIPRRDALGVGRRNLLAQITGSGVDDADGVADFSVVILSKELGIESQEAAKVYRDAAYFLWKDGVYRWSSEGLECLSDGKPGGRGGVRSWFATDDFFNRDRYPYAFAVIDPNRPCYRLFLASAGSTVIDTWVEYDIAGDSWWGPHSTSLFDPTSAFMRTNVSNRALPMIGGATAVYGERALRTDGAATAIDFDIIGARHAHGDPDREKFFGEISVFQKAQAAGTLQVIARVGEVNKTTSATQNCDMTVPRKRLGRLGVGKHAQIELRNVVAGIDVELYGYVIDPVNVFGRR
jgi:hypothetical protein